ncbi:hypothetical protein DFP72DRAFT_1082885 [Ephemerocybe angulata]|uniref:Ribonuclease H1 N-terminal domain-containing protein n=1 Tax=Ephemerocybe angulata TaxID=980116 RepID=A0A8H6LSC8_9AGAR|nr:hypothetical protein DFP72DRAFT_1082885 [Tulosesus angulatus]
MNQARRALRGVTLTSSMRDLLGLMIRSIDLRIGMLGRANDREDEYRAETCVVCDGTGFVMVPHLEGGGNSDDNEAVTVPDSSDDDSTHSASNQPASPMSASLPGVAGASAAGVAGASAAQASSLAPPFANLTLMTPPPTAAPSVPTPNIVFASASTAPPPNLVTPAAPAPAVASVFGAIAQPSEIPDASTVIPGFHSLGPTTPAPAPANALFTEGGEDRYYVVTKGIRVGVFGGWPNTSPYVTGVASASFSRHRSIQSAYTAYVFAWSRGAVAYV